MKRVNVAIIGCGYIAEMAHIPNILSIPEAKLVALCDINEKSLKALGNKYNIKEFYQDNHKLLERDDIDAVIICTPTKTHAKISIDALNAGKHVFVEKPMATSLSEAREVFETVKKNNAKLMIGYQMRFLPNHQRAKRMLRKGELGQIIFIEAHSETLIIKPEDGILLDYTCHFIDLLQWYLNEAKITKVSAILHIDEKYNTETGASLTLQFENKVIGIINTYWLPRYSTWAAVDRYVRIVGTKGKIITEQSGPTLTIYKEGTLLSRIMGPHKIMPKFTIHPKLPLSQIAYRKELEHFINSILKDRQPKPSAEDGIAVIATIEAAKRSFTEGKIINVTE